MEWVSVSSSNFYLPLRVARPAWQDPCNLLSLTEWLALAYCRPLSDPGLTAPLSNLNRLRLSPLRLGCRRGQTHWHDDSRQLDISSSSDSTARARAASEAQAGPCRFKSADSESASPHPQAATGSLTLSLRVWHTQDSTVTDSDSNATGSGCQCMPTSESPPACPYMPVYASICKYMQVYACICKYV